MTLLNMMLSLVLFLNLLFLTLQHPLAMIFVLASQTALISVTVYMFLHFAWFSYSLILVFLGGMLVIFMYMSNVASNEMFKPKSGLMILFPISILLWFIIDLMIPSTSSSMALYSTDLFQISKPFYFSIMPMMIISAVMIIVAMLAVVKITKMRLGPLRIS